MRHGALADAAVRAEEQALIAEARAHARRRRRRLAFACTAAAITVIAGTAAGLAISGTPHASPAPQRRAGLTAHTGVVTGHLDPCVVLVRRVTPGTVTVLRGKITWKQVGDKRARYQTWRLVLPATPAVGEERITDNYRQTFSFALPPGHYVLVGRYDAGGPSPATFAQATIVAGRTAMVDLPGLCK